MIVPSYSELYESIKTDLRNKLQIPTLVGKMVFLAFASVQAAKLKIFYLTISQLNKNIFVDTCDNDTIIRFGFIKLGRYPYPALAGEYNIIVTGSIGATIPPGTTFKSTDNSASPDNLFILDSLFTFASTTGTVLVRATTPGTISILNPSDQLQLTAPLALVDSYAIVDTVQVIAVDSESLDTYRALTIQAFRTEPQGGSKTDYMLWALDSQSVRKVYPYLKAGSIGDLNIYVEAFIGDSTDNKGTPSSATLTEVASVIETDPITGLGRRPMGCNSIYFLPIFPLNIDIAITNLSSTVDLVQLQSSINTFLNLIRPFVDGGDDINSKNDKLYEADIYKIVRDLLNAGESFDSLTLSVNGTLQTVYTFINGDIPYLNSVTAV